VVDSNLAIAFPEKSIDERKKIAKQFYKNFTDNFIETIKLLSISKKELNKRFTGNFDVINNIYPLHMPLTPQTYNTL
jgi:KDO2-lipid IV(A) lauroyltransferase